MKAHGRRMPLGWGLKEKCLRHNIIVKLKQECPECKKEEKKKKVVE